LSSTGRFIYNEQLLEVVLPLASANSTVDGTTSLREQ